MGIVFKYAVYVYSTRSIVLNDPMRSKTQNLKQKEKTHWHFLLFPPNWTPPSRVTMMTTKTNHRKSAFYLWTRNSSISYRHCTDPPVFRPLVRRIYSVRSRTCYHCTNTFGESLWVTPNKTKQNYFKYTFFFGWPHNTTDAHTQSCIYRIVFQFPNTAKLV